MKPVAQVTALLRDAITGGQLMPNERLVEVELAARFGTTRAHVRSALVALEGEGLVVSEPNRGARVRRITAEEALEITDARAALEGLVAAQAAERATPQDIARMEGILARMRTATANADLLGYSTLNGELHAEIRRISRHAVANKLLQMLNSQIVRFQFSAILIPGRAGKSLAEHEAIVAAIGSHDAQRAGKAMARHLGHVRRALQQAIAAQQAPAQRAGKEEAAAGRGQPPARHRRGNDRRANAP